MYRMRRFSPKSRMRRLLSLGPPNYAIQGTYKSGLDREPPISNLSDRPIALVTFLSSRTTFQMLKGYMQAEKHAFRVTVVFVVVVDVCRQAISQIGRSNSVWPIMVMSRRS
jgi:hypothetical protein